MEVITSNTNSKVKLIKHLQKRRWRDKTGLAFLEGTRLVEDVIRAGVDIEFIGFFPDLLESQRGREFYQWLCQSDLPLYCFDSSLRHEIMQTVSPQSVLAVVRTPSYAWNDILAAQTILVINGVQDPGNLGTMLRTADAMGVGAVITTKGTCDIYNAKALRGAMASTFRIPILAGVASSEAIAQLRKAGFTIVATAVDGAQALPKYSFRLPTALVLGNEGAGVEQLWLECADGVVAIPIKSSVESLNVGIACGILLYELARQVGLVASDSAVV